MKAALWGTLKVSAWVLLAVVLLFLAFFVYPGLSESTKWTIAGVFLALVVAYHLNEAETKANNWREAVGQDLADLKRQMDRIERRMDSVNR